jgi:hypothetical protein
MALNINTSCLTPHRKVNLYLAAHQKSGTQPAALLLRKASAYVTRILTVFGLVDHPADNPGATCCDYCCCGGGWHAAITKALPSHLTCTHSMLLLFSHHSRCLARWMP